METSASGIKESGTAARVDVAIDMGVLGAHLRAPMVIATNTKRGIRLRRNYTIKSTMRKRGGADDCCRRARRIGTRDSRAERSLQWK